jgi:PPOX class probable F420-dependent enzyme
MATLPEEARQIIDEPHLADLVTLMKDGSPQVTPLWIDREGDVLRVNTAEGRQKLLNLTRDPRVAVLVLDRNDGFRWVQVRGRVIEMIGGDEAFAHIDSLAHKYMGRAYSGPNDGKRVMIKIAVDHVTFANSRGGMPASRR